MEVMLYQVDAFTDRVFAGNPAAVCPLTKWPDDKTLQNIAAENNLSETAFFVRENDGYRLRWFTPLTEVNLCGHATLATAFVIYNFIEPGIEEIEFQSLSGPLLVRRRKELIELNFPVSDLEKVAPDSRLQEALGARPVEVWNGIDLMAVFSKEEEVAGLEPDFGLLKNLEARGVIVTAPGQKADFVSRFFGPAVGIDEDPVTGSAHTMLTPFWAGKLGKKEMLAHQISKRGGVIQCILEGDRVLLSGKAVLYLTGEINI